MYFITFIESNCLSSEFFAKNEKAIKAGASGCYQSGNFNPDPNGNQMTYDGLLWENDEVGLDTPKCIYIIS